jgi:DNA-binding beta-propeller fold protein YncE
VVSLGVLLGLRPFGGQSQEALSDTAGFLLGLVIVGALLWGAYRVAKVMSRRQAWFAVTLAVIGMMLVVNTRYSLLANFVNDELANEYIVYAHGTPDDKLVYDMLLDMQTRLGVDEPLTLAYDNEVSWPFTWYFRHTDWSDAHYVGEKPGGPLQEDVVLVGSPNYGQFEPYLRDRYVSIEYRRMWWPNEGYKSLTWQKVRRAVTDPKSRRNWLRILLFRRYTTDPAADQPEEKPLTDWYHHANMRLYIRQDLVERLWPLAQTRPDWAAAVEPSEPPPRTELNAEVVLGEGPDGIPLVAPKDIALAEDGSLFVVDHQNERIVVFDADGTPREVLADGVLRSTGDQAEPSAWGITVGADGAVYIADTWNHRVRKYVDGVEVAAWGRFAQPPPEEPLSEPDAFYGPRDVAVGPDGYVYVTDTGNKRVCVFDADGTAIRCFGGFGYEPGQFSEPTGLAFDPATGDLYVADLWNLRVQRFDRNLIQVLEWPVDGWDSQEAAHKAYIAVGPGGTVVLSDPHGGRVWVYDSEGTVLTTLDLPDDSKGLDQPVGVAVDDQGRIFVASSISGIVTRYAAPVELLEAAGLAAPPAEGEEGEEGEAAEEAAEEESAGAEGAGEGAAVGEEDEAAEEAVPGDEEEGQPEDEEALDESGAEGEAPAAASPTGG